MEQGECLTRFGGNGIRRTVIWDSTFGSFMEERARRKRERDRTSQDYSGDRYTETGKLRKKYSKRATGKGATTSEAVLSSTAASSRVSKNINYDALKVTFGSRSVDCGVSVAG